MCARVHVCVGDVCCEEEEGGGCYRRFRVIGLITRAARALKGSEITL